MAFDQTTRNRLARFVGDARALLTEEFTRQLQHEYGLDPASGEITPIEGLTALDDARRETARILRETLGYYLAGKAEDAGSRTEQLERIVREQAFTVLNRLCALRMSEARGLVLESVAKGYQSQGFQLYARLAGSALGETGEAYHSYLFSVMDEFAVDLPVLFDRFSPQGRLFPREAALLKLLELINDPEIDLLWVEDETIGWIYQYFNSQEERKQMRAESQAPRNSRELAVRNQFFTPRYVVEFLTDNTLGRIWYEMTKGETALKEADRCRYLVCRPNEVFLKDGEEAPPQPKNEEDLTQEELLQQPVYIPHRPLKDPREIKMLDPACGSMHFGLYAFDLFEIIYEEAWELEERLGPDALWRLVDLEPLHETYPDRVAFLRDVPRLIIERNIHGVDIDPRAVQIAGLSLWLRAQKSWQAQGLKAHQRPQIRKSNVVCAEPMPGDRDMLEEFLATLTTDKLEALMRQTRQVSAGGKVRATPQMAEALAKLVRIVWQEMELAGEAGSLLKIEETLREAIATARKESEEKSPLFRVLEFGLDESPQEQAVRLLSGEEQDFFDRAEGLVLAALREYAGQAENGGGYRRRLFAGDAVQGFAFIDLCRKNYDVVLMNPPYGDFSSSVFDFAKSNYSGFSANIYSAFWVRATILCRGVIGALTSRTFLSLSQFENLRKKLLNDEHCLRFVVDLGSGVLDDAAVDTCASILNTEDAEKIENILFFQVDFCDTREYLLYDLISNLHNGFYNERIYIQPRYKLVSLPGQRILYWASKRILDLFSSGINFENNIGKARPGLCTGDDFRFICLRWEIPAKNVSKEKWVTFAKGGNYERYYSDLNFVINWRNDGKELKSYVQQTVGSISKWVFNENFYFRSGITFPNSSALGFSARCLPENSIISVKGQGIYPNSTPEFSIALLNTNLVHGLLYLFNPGKDVQAGDVKILPFTEPIIKDADISERVYKIINSLRLAHSMDETSPIFISIPTNSDKLRIDLENLINEIIVLEDELEECIYESIGISLDEVKDFVLRIKRRPSVHEFLVHSLPNLFSENAVSISYISFAFGVCLGIWDIRYALNKKKASILPDPFAPLSACPPGMLQNDHGLPITPHETPKDYPIRISWYGILVDDEGHIEDIEQRVRETLYVVWRESAEAIEQESCQILGVRSLREYFQKPTQFFADHLKRYSKSRRYAPIYWPLSTPSCSYTLWLYYHRLNDQILFTCVNDFVDPKLKQVAEEAARLRQKQGRSAADEKELERLTDFERELRDFREELLRVAAFWKPNLNDGVQITAAPLWKLFQHKPWQKKLKETWQKLEAGEYDWAHLAYSIWPDRVRKKCKTDKSLAIAHDLEHLYVEPEKPKKQKKTKKQDADEETEGWFNDD